MAEHFDAQQLALGTAYILINDDLVDCRYLVHIQFTCKHDHIGELGIELHRLAVAYVKLCRQMHFYAHSVTVLHDSHVGCDYRRDTALLCRINNFLHHRNVILIDDGIDRQIALYTMFVTYLRNLTQVID